MSHIIYENKLIRVETEEFEIPWLKIFTQKPIREFSMCDKKTKYEILRCLDIIEKDMLEYYKPEKINISSFGNYIPHVHFHIQARFKEDSFFPEPTWGKKQRDAMLNLKGYDTFCKNVVLKLEQVVL